MQKFLIGSVALSGLLAGGAMAETKDYSGYTIRIYSNSNSTERVNWLLNAAKEAGFSISIDDNSVISGDTAAIQAANENKDGDILFGLADLGYPELGSWSLTEMAAIRLPFGLGIERDLHFEGRFPISVWAEAARETGSIRAAERLLYRVGASFSRTSADTENRSA